MPDDNGAAVLLLEPGGRPLALPLPLADSDMLSLSFGLGPGLFLALVLTFSAGLISVGRAFPLEAAEPADFAELPPPPPPSPSDSLSDILGLDGLAFTAVSFFPLPLACEGAGADDVPAVSAAAAAAFCDASIAETTALGADSFSLTDGLTLPAAPDPSSVLTFGGRPLFFFSVAPDTIPAPFPADATFFSAFFFSLSAIFCICLASFTIHSFSLMGPWKTHALVKT
mmetsp:Transcript_19948/g.43526  ORF Transcript_19948/g.43526 Transcript_19948/m.43526 type:complete len:227 (+) Transcript_19948:337-1017(+)